MKTVLLKVSGELFTSKNTCYNKQLVTNIIEQLKKLKKDICFGIVVGGGNFFRGTDQGEQLALSRTTADTVGMLATLMNALILQNLLSQNNISSVVLSSIHAPQVASSLKPSAIQDALSINKLIIFAGGTGNPYFSTDTNAVVRALQMGATEVWKATKVDYVYDSDPTKNNNSKPLQKVSYNEAITQKLDIMDMTALTLAQENHLTIRVFNIFTSDSLINVARNKNFGSIISNDKL